MEKDTQFYSLILATTEKRIVLAMLLKTTNNQTSFKFFLLQLSQLYRGTIVMDNARIHHASNDRLIELGFKGVYLAPYLPESNACEYLFRVIKQKLRAGRTKATPEMIAQVTRNLHRGHCESAFNSAITSLSGEGSLCGCSFD